MLARERADKGLGVAEIAAQLRYSAKQIEALESDDYARLPGMTFVRGMIRGYAKILGVPSAPMLEVLEQRHVPPPVTVDLRATRVPFPDGKARSTRVYAWLCAAMLVVVAGVFYEWNFGLPQIFGDPSPAAPQEVARSQAVEPAIPASPPPAEQVPAETVAAPVQDARPPAAATVAQVPRGAASLRFDFQKDAWVEVKDATGRTLIAQINQAGTQSTIEGTPPFALIIGNATNVKMSYGDKPLDLAQYIKFDVARFTLE